MARTDLPTGTVTFLFTDIEGSTRLLGHLGGRFPAVLEEHQRLLREAFTSAGGVEVSTEGDSFFVVFSRAADAVEAAVGAQRALAAHPWEPDSQIRVRMGLHTGDGVLGADDYVGLDVHRASRIAAAGHGGQIVVSEPTRALVAPAAPDRVSFRDLGEHRLKDLPEPERLYQVVAAGVEQDFPAIRTGDARRGNLPLQLTSFIGRRREVDEAKKALGETRLLTLTGPGGTGKTRLSLQVAAEAQDEHPDGTYFVALAPLTDASLVAPTIAQALGLREQPGRPAMEIILEHLRGHRVLLVLDNFEQVLDAADQVGELLGSSPDLRVVVTSREALHVQGEREYPVPTLGLPDPARLPPLEALSQYEAVALFIERARAVRPDFQITNENAPAVAEICARLDGLPLAIELAAARVKLLSPQAMLKRLENRLTLLAGGARDLPARQQTLRGAIAWSYDLLDEEERRFFARLSVFLGGFTLEAVDAVCAEGLATDALDGVSSMVNKSLLRQTESPHGEPRFFMLETIREFATERLAESEDAATVPARHAAYFLDVAASAAPDLFGAKQADLLDALQQDHDNFRAAITWAADSRELSTALRLGGALWRFWQMRGHLREGAERLGQLVDSPGAEEDPEALAAALEGAGGITYWMGRWDEAERYYTRCLELRRRLGDRAALAEALYNLSFVYAVPAPPRQDLERALRLNDEALQIYQELDDRRGRGKVLWNIAHVEERRRNPSQSRDAARRAVELFREVDDRFGLGWALHSEGIAEAQLQEFDEAESAFTEAMEIFSMAGDHTGIALLLGDFGFLAGSLGDTRRGSRLWGAALAAEERSGQALVSNFDENVFGWGTAIRGSLSEQEYERLVAEGREMEMEEAIRFALRRDDEPVG